MDPNQLLPYIQGVLTGPNGFLYAVATFFALQWVKAKWPDSPLLKWLPKLTPNPSPAPSPSPATPSTGRPLLDGLLKLLPLSRAEEVLSAELHRMYQEPPPLPSESIAGRSGRASVRLLVAFCLGFAAVFGLGRAILAGEAVDHGHDRHVASIAQRHVAEAGVGDTSPVATGDTSAADPEALEIPIANRLVYRLARDKAAEIYAKDNKITERAAAAKLAKVSDSSLHTAFKASKLAHPVGDTLEDVLRWLVDHKELIFEVAKLLIALLALL